MKISPIASTANLAPAPMDQNTGTAVQNFQHLRSVKMKTNYNPEEYDPNSLAQPPINERNTQAASEETQPLSPQFAALAKQRRALQRERELLEKEKALATSPGQVESIEVARLKSEPLKVLLENGVTYEDLTQAILNNQENSEIYALRREMDAYKQEMKDTLDQREANAEKQALMEMANEARSLIHNSNEFELIRSMGHLPDVTRLIEQVYRKDGQLLTVHEACSMIENELFEDIQKVASVEKVRSRISQPTPQARPMQQHSGMRTLTNRDTATVPLTAKQRAIAAFHGTLKR